ncbi:MAG: guanylate kinase, partial [Clostridia bacterium]|nr:guanylate kinase [Clostridia bacterium]
DGKDYHFITREEFMRRVENDGFLEYNVHFKSCYGTPKPFVVENLKTKHVLLEIEVDGALKVKEAMPDCVMVMILPPSVEELRERLFKRGTEAKEKIEERLARFDYELSKKDEYQYVIVNDDLSEAVDKLSAILDME